MIYPHVALVAYSLFWVGLDPATVSVHFCGKCRGMEVDLQLSLRRRLGEKVKWNGTDPKSCIHVYDVQSRMGATHILDVLSGKREAIRVRLINMFPGGHKSCGYWPHGQGDNHCIIFIWECVTGSTYLLSWTVPVNWRLTVRWCWRQQLHKAILTSEI